MKNSWGCNWGDVGYFKQSWAFNSESYFLGIKMDGNSSFINDVPHDEEPSCAVPEDSNNSDHCAQWNEFGVCLQCNSGYQNSDVNPDIPCVLQDEDISEDDETEPIDDGETISEDIFWQVCTSSTNTSGFLCPADNDGVC